MKILSVLCATVVGFVGLVVSLAVTGAIFHWFFG